MSKMTANKQPTPEERAKANKEALKQFLKDNPVYECDPDKNTDCRKTGCYINGGECHLTRHSLKAKRDLLGYAIKGKVDEE